MKRILSLTLAILLLPILASAFCPCAEAAPEQVVLQTVPCRGCCPKANLSKSECQPAVISKAPALNLRDKTENLRLELVPAAFANRVVSNADSASLISPPFRFPQSEIYLTLQVLRL